MLSVIISNVVAPSWSSISILFSTWLSVISRRSYLTLFKMIWPLLWPLSQILIALSPPLSHSLRHARLSVMRQVLKSFFHRVNYFLVFGGEKKIQKLFSKMPRRPFWRRILVKKICCQMVKILTNCWLEELWDPCLGQAAFSGLPKDKGAEKTKKVAPFYYIHHFFAKSRMR